MSSLTYARYEMLRTVRNVRFLLFSLAFPLVLLVVVGGRTRASPTSTAPASPSLCTTCPG